MSFAGSSTAWPRWLDPTKGFSDDIPPRKRQLALALRALCRLLDSENLDKPAESWLTQAQAAKRLGCTADMLSRYLNRDRVPSRSFVERLYKEACADAAASGQDVSISSETLLALHASAAGERRGCEHCTELGGRIDSLTQQLDAPCPACMAHQREQEACQRQRKQDAARLRSARREAARLRAAVAALKAQQAEGLTAEAGLRDRLEAARNARALLPVPLSEGTGSRA